MASESGNFRGKMKSLLGFLGLAWASQAAAFVGEWKSYSDFNAVNAMIEYHGSVYVGTQGGVRKIAATAPFSETDFNNMHGIADVRIVGLTIDSDDRLWAASRSGQLFRLEGARWSAWGKSYKSAGWTINTRAVASAGKYIILGSEKGLSFFDRAGGVAAANLTKFGDLGSQGVTGLLRVGDTLFIATGSAVLRAAVDWQNVLSGKYNGTLFDPQIWKTVSDTVGLPAFATRMKGEKDPAAPVDSLKPADTTTLIDLNAGRPVELVLINGRVTAHDSGTLLVSPFPVKALRGRQLLVDGVTISNRVDIHAALPVNGILFLGGAGGLVVRAANGDYSGLNQSRFYPNKKVAAIAARDGNVVWMTENALLEWNGMRDGKITQFDFPFPSAEVLMNELRNVAYSEDGSVILGGWGFGVIQEKRGAAVRTWTAENSCLKSVIGKDYTVIHSMSDPRGDDLWLTLLDNVESKPHYSMAYLNLKTGESACPELAGNSYHTSSTRILSDRLFGVAGPSGILLYEYGVGGVKGAIRSAGSIKSGGGSDNGLDLAMVESQDRIWALMNGKIGFIDSVSDKTGETATLTWKPFEDFTGKNCRAMEMDTRQGLWVGCDNGVYHILSATVVEASSIWHYDSDDGLLGDRILDLALDKSNGKLWAATENGVNVFETTTHAAIPSLTDVKVYPNPFREKHRMVILDNLPDGASATVFTQSGNVVRRFFSKDAKGHQFQWDGTNAAGARVKPGIYFYNIEGAGKSTRGKIIVAR
ncbi:MAG: T9SS type A sorting domain-containing protein [Fibrobacterota bacterium]|nr:T9SS type A sorting domain-containing protein [Fibrobacterota bacterium]